MRIGTQLGGLTDSDRALRSKVETNRNQKKDGGAPDEEGAALMMDDDKARCQ
jgi:hypothetical protein